MGVGAINYGDLIKDAFRISWHNKYLWFFGFFAGGSELVGRINGNGGKAVSVECDVTDEEAEHGLIRHARDALGRVDILVNNAGGMLLSKIEKGLSDQWRQMFDVNASVP